MLHSEKNLGWWIGTFNFFQAIKEAVDNQWSDLITEYERRVDIFLNLSKNVKGFKNHEKETFEQIASLRSGNKKETKQQSMARLGKLDSLISGLNINVEAYPQLKASELFQEFMGEIRITEDRINGARTGYNTVVREYETKRVTFPSNIIARHHKFKEIKYYETSRSDVSGKAPEVNV